MLLSICIPTYNRAFYLNECLESITKAIKKSGREVEVVISDNASPDHTPDIVDSYRKLLPIVVYHRNEETIFAEENFYLVGQKASGKYIWLIGDDDKIREDAVVEAFEALEALPPVVICNFSQYTKNFARQTSPARYPSGPGVQLQSHNDMLRHFGTYLAFISGAIVDKDLFYSVDKKEYDHYKQYGLSFFYVLCKIAVNQKINFINQSVVQCRTGNSGNYDWVKYMIIGYDETFKDLIKCGYSQAAVDQVKHDFLKNEVFWYLLKLKADGESTNYAYAELHKRYNTNNLYGYLINMVRYVPASFFTSIRRLKTSLIKS